MPASNADPPRPSDPLVFLSVTAVFFLSGAAGLVYQVLWMRSLGLFFGSDMYGVSIILSTFMGGLALGSLAGGWLSQRTLRPLLWYGVAEVLIGVVALAFGAILESFDPLLRSAYLSDAAAVPWTYQTTRILLAAGTLLVPTTLMGATLPLILRQFVRSRTALGQSGAYFYALNTLGALCGTLAAGFALLPRLGMTRTTLCAAALNLGIGVVCVAVGSRLRLPPAPETLRRVEQDPLPELPDALRRRIARVALLAFGVSGFGSFALEVLWTRILLISFSATVYSFAATLACFLFGIFFGTRLVARMVDRHPDPVRLFAALELGCGASVAVLALLLHGLPGAFGRLLATLAGQFPGAQEHVLVLATLLASFPLLVVPATLLGATFPVALRIHTTSLAHVGSHTGRLYAANTLGAVLGALAAGLLLIPWLGAMASLVLVAALFLLVGTALTFVSPTPSSRRPAAVAALVTLVCGSAALLLPYRVTLNFNQANLDDAEILYHAEGIQNTIDVVRSPSGATSLIIGGNVEADDGERQRRHFILKGHLPLLLADAPRTVLVVGLGMGITLQATARHPGIERIDVIELSPEILAAQAQLGEVNGHVVEHPRVHVRIDDGRLYMKLAPGRFDMITADPIHPKISRVGYLYTEEYYRSIRERLGEGGVVCQWMPLYQMAPRRLRSAVKTFLRVFPTATLWYVEGHALLVAGRDATEIDFPRLAERFAAPAVREDLASIGIDSPVELLSHLIMGPEEIRAFVEQEERVPVNTDDHPYLEYYVPIDLFYTSGHNLRELQRHLAEPGRLVSRLPEGEALRLTRESEALARRMHALANGGAAEPR